MPLPHKAAVIPLQLVPSVFLGKGEYLDGIAAAYGEDRGEIAIAQTQLFVVLAIGQPQGLGQSVCLAHLLTGLTGIFTPV